MLRKILFAINLLRAVPAFACLSGTRELIRRETEGYTWFLESYDGDSFFLRFAWLMWRCGCYRSQVAFRCAQVSTARSYLIRLLYPPKKQPDFFSHIRVFEIHHVEFPHHGLSPNGELCQRRVGVRENVVHKGYAEALLDEI